MSRPTFWPDTSQTVLLHAVLDEPDRARAAVIQWLKSVDFEGLDAGSQRLLPLLHNRLQLLGIDHPLAARIKGIYRRNWYLDQRLRRHLRVIRAAFHEAGIDCILLKGAALGLTVYAHGALRPADDIDLLVHPANFDHAVDVLVQTGLRLTSASKHASSFHSDIGVVDLHVSPFHARVDDNAIKPLWSEMSTAIVDGAPANLLSPHDQLLQTLTHGLQTNPVPPIRWVADAVLTIRHYESELNWTRFASRAEQLCFSLVSSRGLNYLVNEFATRVPEGIIGRLNDCTKSTLERIEFHCKRNDRLQPLAKWALTYEDIQDASFSRRCYLVAQDYRAAWKSPNTVQLLSRGLVRLMLGRRLAAWLYSRSWRT